MRSIRCKSAWLNTVLISALAVPLCYAAVNPGYQTNYFDSDLPHSAVPAAHVDTNLVNPWGIIMLNDMLVVADNGTGLISTFAPATGTPARATVIVPPPAGSQGTAAPSGLALNPTTTNFEITVANKRHPAVYFIATEDGTLSAWNSFSGTKAIKVIDNSAQNAVYKSVAVAFTADNIPAIYLANFRSGWVEMYGTNFGYVQEFTDTNLTALGFAPFGMRRVQNKLVVAFAKQDSLKHDDVAGPGNGYIDIFNPDGALVRQFAAQGALNSPWGMAVAPLQFGKFSQSLLVANFGDGEINAYNLLTGEYLGPLTNASGAPISLSGAWGLTFNTEPAFHDLEYIASVLYFTAGLNHEADGLLGSIRALNPLLPPIH